jgi:dTDP-4-amino-4,6-dideoxygalactose transaminase
VSQPRIPAVDLKAQYEHIRDEVEQAVRRVFERQNFLLGEEVAEFEQGMARLCGAAFAVGCASGSDALILSLMAAGIGPGDAVLVPAFSFFASASSVALVGARPVFLDIDPQTMNINPAAAQRALDSAAGASAKAILPVHLYGQCADMSAIEALAASHQLTVIEDAAQAILAHHRGRAAGSMGLAGCFSFYPTKNLSAAGDAGMVVTNDAAIAERLRQLRNHGSLDKVTFPLLGVNSRLDTLQAAVLLVKLQHIEEWTRLRKRKAAFYRQAFATTNLVSADIYPAKDAPVVLPFEAEGSDHVYHQFTIRAHDRDALAKHLEGAGIGTAVYYPVPLDRQPALAAWSEGSWCPEAARAAGEVLSLPIYPELTDSQQSYVVGQIRAFYSMRSR